ncbi:hypothetical protein BDB00DRAFT_810886 [Zychaea mexicana]|uniref:uncharacterized protein n=1 Tax=Zychaea mexicana TaxID=64656 RepID=UPI0022FE7540|nr:uncharacterized protein BDB00DRAFT_810886 [Zychaea mexicana]KAI9495902.1 hypothetical protein BDB00DRAFT_810886 [Zychaea mexicana]
MNRADGFSLHHPTVSESSVSTDQEEQSSIWSTLNTAFWDTAQYASEEFDRFFENMGFKNSGSPQVQEHQCAAQVKALQDQQYDTHTDFATNTTLPLPSSLSRQSTDLQDYSTPSSSTCSTRSAPRNVSLSMPSSTSTGSRKRSHDDDNDPIAAERAEKIRKIGEIETMLRELKEEATLDNSPSTVSSSPANRTPTAAATATRTTTEKPKPRLDDDRPQAKDTRMQRLEERIEHLQTQVACLISSQARMLKPSGGSRTSSIRGTNGPRTGSLAKQTSTAPSSSSAPSLSSPLPPTLRSLPIPSSPSCSSSSPPPSSSSSSSLSSRSHHKNRPSDKASMYKPTPLATASLPLASLQNQVPTPRSSQAKGSNNEAERKSEPKVSLPSPPPPPSAPTQSPNRNRLSTAAPTFAVSTSSSAAMTPTHEVKISLTMQRQRASRTAPETLSKVSSDTHMESMRAIVQQIPNVKLRRTDMLRLPDGTLKPNPIWSEMYRTTPRYKRSRAAMERENEQQQNDHLESSPASPNTASQQHEDNLNSGLPSLKRQRASASDDL